MWGAQTSEYKTLFWAAQLKPIIIWLQDLSSTRRLDIEKSLCVRPLMILPFPDTPLRETQMGEWTRLTLNIWRKMWVA